MSARVVVRLLVLALIAVLSASHPRGAVVAQAATGSLRVERLRTEYKENPLGLDVRAPRFSWQIRSDTRNVRQQAYHVRVARSDHDLRSGRNLAWDSGRVTSGDSIHRAYAGVPLASGQRYVWQVQVWDDRGRASGWSAPAWWEMGLLSPSDWRAQWIEPGLPEDVTTSPPAPMLRRAFRLGKPVRSARAYVTSHGLYALHLNGARVSEDVLTPGWTSYNKRLHYQTYDVTPMLRRGDNAVGVVLGNGWYRGNVGFSKQRNMYGERLALLLQIDVTFADGTRASIASDDRWRASTGPILMSEIYHGETYDARLEKAGWDGPGFDDHAWTAAVVADFPKDTLVAPAGPPVRRMNEITPKEIVTTPKGEQVVDMGQNMVGWVRLRVDGPAGTTVKASDRLERTEYPSWLYPVTLLHVLDYSDDAAYMLVWGRPSGLLAPR